MNKALATLSDVLMKQISQSYVGVWGIGSAAAKFQVRVIILGLVWAPS